MPTAATAYCPAPSRTVPAELDVADVYACASRYCGAIFTDEDAEICEYCQAARCPECGEDCCEDYEAERRAEEAIDRAVDFAIEGYDD